MQGEGHPREPTARGGIFATTHWSVVLAAGRQESIEGEAALEQLCRTYWYPLYAFVRRQGHAPEDARDLTQGFFLHLIENHGIEKADPARGRFRTFLLALLKHYLADERDRARAVRRGGGRAVWVRRESEADERRYQAMAGEPLTPEQVFDQDWATALLEGVLARLGAEAGAAGKGGLFEALREHLMGDELPETYGEAARRLGTTEAAVKMGVMRLRQRYREMLRVEIGRTVEAPDQVEAEIRHLIGALRGPG